MSISKKSKKYILITISIIVVIGVLNSVISSVIKNKLTEVLLQNEGSNRTVNIENVKFRLIQRSLIFENVTLIPTKEAVSELIDDSAKENSLENITLSSISFKGIGLYQLLFSKKININTIVLNDLFIRKLSNSNIKTTKKPKEKKPLDIDSIVIKKLNGLQINTIKVNNFKYQVFDYASNEITFQNKPLSFISSGIKLEKHGDSIFRLIPIKNKFSIHDIYFELEDANYDFSMGEISFDFEENLIDINNLKVKPQMNKFEMADTYRFNKDVFDIALINLKIFNFNLKKMLKNEGVFIDSIGVSGLNLSLFKDKRKPFNTQLHKKLLSISLKQLKTPLYINKVKVNSTNLIIEEKLAKKDTMLYLSINNINAEIKNITSIKSYREKPLLVSLNGQLMNSADLSFNLKMPLKDSQNTFYFNGTLGASKLELFDAALYPALGLKIFSGQLEGITFSASANSTESNGTMTMLYHDLEATVFKSNTLEKNNFLSWSVNKLVRKSNPNHKGKVKEVLLHTKRIQYKGLGNYIWKTAQSGIINTISPAGKKVKRHKK